eukprot:gene12519-846_t
MACVFMHSAEPVGRPPGERRALADFIGLFFAMRRDRRAGEQLPMCEVWAWLTSALQAEHYEWRN